MGSSVVRCNLEVYSGIQRPTFQGEASRVPRYKFQLYSVICGFAFVRCQTICRIGDVDFWGCRGRDVT